MYLKTPYMGTKHFHHIHPPSFPSSSSRVFLTSPSQIHDLTSYSINVSNTHTHAHILIIVQMFLGVEMTTLAGTAYQEVDL